MTRATAVEKQSERYKHLLFVKFGGVSANRKTARLSLRIETNTPNGISDKLAQELFINAELDFSIIAKAESDNDVKGQQTIDDVAKLDQSASAMVAGYSVRGDHISLSLVMIKGSIALDEMSRFCGLNGELHCTKVGAAKLIDDEDKDE